MNVYRQHCAGVDDSFSRRRPRRWRGWRVPAIFLFAYVSALSIGLLDGDVKEALETVTALLFGGAAIILAASRIP